jgi:hypothetical protein
MLLFYLMGLAAGVVAAATSATGVASAPTTSAVATNPPSTGSTSTGVEAILFTIEIHNQQNSIHKAIKSKQYTILKLIGLSIVQ